MGSAFSILVLEDNPDDAFLLQLAFKKNRINSPIHVVPDGLEAIDYLAGMGKYGDRVRYPQPRVLVIDIKMPRMNGLEFLEWLRRHPELGLIPTLVLSSSQAAVEVAEAYKLGANSYMVKPAKFDDLQELVKLVNEYWNKCVIPIQSDSKPA